MNYTLEPLRITKEFLFRRIREELIMEHYLGIPVKKGLFKSPLRRDNKPTCAFYRNSKGDLIFKDFSGQFSGNCISVVMYKFDCSFHMALQIIANDFNLIDKKNLAKNKAKMEYSNTIFEESKTAIIQVQIQDYSEYELEWWSKYGITENTLKKYKVFSCKNVFLNNNIFHLHQNNQLVFGYFGGIKDSVEQWRIYFPNKKKYKFISNWTSNQIQGVSQINKNGGDLIVITKSLKDVMTLHEFGIQAIAPISEHLFISNTQYQKLKSKFKNIILFYDNDLTGIQNINKIRKMYSDLLFTFIPKKYKVKDISDFRKKYGEIKTKDLINNYLNNGKKK